MGDRVSFDIEFDDRKDCDVKLLLGPLLVGYVGLCAIVDQFGKDNGTPIQGKNCAKNVQAAVSGPSGLTAFSA